MATHANCRQRLAGSCVNVMSRHSVSITPTEHEHRPYIEVKTNQWCRRGRTRATRTSALECEAAGLSWYLQYLRSDVLPTTYRT